MARTTAMTTNYCSKFVACFNLVQWGPNEIVKKYIFHNLFDVILKRKSENAIFFFTELDLQFTFLN